MTVCAHDHVSRTETVHARSLRANLRIVLIMTLSALLAFGCFASGFLTCLRLKRTHVAAPPGRELSSAGNAPAVVRAGVLESLRLFQEGYVKRDPANLIPFTQRLFPKDGDILILGMDSGESEWARGTAHAARFIERDWRQWGDFRFDVDHSMIWSSGNVAWAASLGTVRTGDSVEPVRFTAILTRDQAGWVFRQVHFQLDDGYAPSLSDLARPSTYRTFAFHATHWIMKHLGLLY